MKKTFKFGCLPIIGIVIIIIIIAVASSSGGNGTKTASGTTKTTATTNKTSSNKKTTKSTQSKNQAKIGVPLKVGNVVFEVTGTSTAQTIGGQYGTKAKGTFLILDVSVKNEGKKSITTDTSFFKLESGGTTYDASATASTYANNNANFFLQQVNPGLSDEGKVVFDVPPSVAKSTNLMLQVQTGAFGTQKGIIALKK